MVRDLQLVFRIFIQKICMIKIPMHLISAYRDLGTLTPMAFSKHFMAAPTAVSSWYTFKPPSD